MSRDLRRVELTPAWVLHGRSYRDTSRILEVLTREHGRLTLFARGVRSGKSALGAILQPFRPLLVAFSGRGDASQLLRAEPDLQRQPAGAAVSLPAAALLPGFYLNELLIKLTTRDDPHPDLYDHYGHALERLRAAEPIEPALREFELRLLEALGYGIDLERDCRSGRPIDPEAYYRYRAGAGFYGGVQDGDTLVAGSSIAQMRAGRLSTARALEDARRVLRLAVESCLDGRALATRSVALSVSAHERKARR